MNQENNDSKICPICGRPTHKQSKYCIFHASAEEKTEKEFKKALNEYIQEIKENNKDYDFKRFVFIGDINFKKDLNINVFKNVNFYSAFFEGEADFMSTTFKGIADFMLATFEEYADFSGVTFKDYTNFSLATFKYDAVFDSATFEENTNFGLTTFKYGADFSNAIFEEDVYVDFKSTIFENSTYFNLATFKFEASFFNATFKGNADFHGATFKYDARFDSATFKGSADFTGVTFKGSADFTGVTFKEDANFKLKYLDKVIKLSKIKVFYGKKLSIKIINEGKKVRFERAYLENTYLDIELVEGILIDFTDALLKNTKFGMDQIENHILQEKKKDFTQAKKVFLLLKNNFRSIGKYEDESWAFTKEKKMERMSFSLPYYKKILKADGKKEKFPILKWIKKGNFLKWVISGFSNMIYGYGEKPWNVIRAAAVIIVLFAFSFGLIGIANPEIIELNGTAIQQNSGNIINLASKGFLKSNVIRNFPDSLYFSTITFTTLGYGDFRPLEGWGRILAGSEAFIGAFMMALFVYTFARRTGGR